MTFLRYMDSEIDLREVAPHRRATVSHRVAVLRAYNDGMIGSASAIKELGVAAPTFWRLARVWRETGRPELLGGWGRHITSRSRLTDLQDAIIREASASFNGGVGPAVDAVLQLAKSRGIEMPGRFTIERRVAQLRLENSHMARGTGVVVAFCAVQIPVLHPVHGSVAPVACLVLEIEASPVLLGLAVEFEANEAAAAGALLDAVATADTSRTLPLEHLSLQSGGDGNWSALETALSKAGLPPKTSELGARSGRVVSTLCGRRPGGLELRPDLTMRSIEKRPLPSPAGGAATLAEVEDAARALLVVGLPGPRQHLVQDVSARARMVSSLRQILRRPVP